MEPKIDELLRVGRERGFLTIEELNAALSPTITAPELDRVLALLNLNGIELIRESEAEPADPAALNPNRRRPVRIYRTARSPETEEWLHGAGIPVEDCICRLEPDGRLYEAEFVVQVKQSLDVWWTLREIAPARGLWPILLSWRRNRRFRLPGEERIPAGGVVEFIEPAESRANIRDTIAAADQIDVAAWFSARIGAGHRDWLLSRSQPATGADTELQLRSESDAWAAARTEFLQFREEVDPYIPARACDRVQLVAAEIPWAVLAARPTGGFNDSPTADVQLAILCGWWQRYGVEVVFWEGDSYQLFVPRPPRTRANALRLAEEMVAFGEDSVAASGGEPCEEVVEYLRTSHFWHFWWD
jgi:hypothetical protein